MTMRILTAVLLAVLAVLAVLAGPAAAQPKALQQGAVRYIHGGIGVDERFELAALRADYSLRLSFAVQRLGNFVADVEVRVTGADGREVLRATGDGPWFFVQLAPGRYSVSATFAGRTQTRAIQVRDKRAVELFYYWEDASAVPDPDMEPERPQAPRR